MVKKVSLILFVILISINAYSFEFGGMLSTTGYSDSHIDKFAIQEYSEVSAWLRCPFTKNSYFTMEGFYSFDINYYANDIVESFIHKADLTLFKFYTKFELPNYSYLNLSLGRLTFADYTGNVLSQYLDGMNLAYQLKDIINISLYSGYNGLVNANNINVDTNLFLPNKVDVYTFSAPYLISGIKINMPALLGQQSLKTEFISSIDLYENSYTKLYGTLTLDGPIYKSIYYSLASCFNFNVVDVVNDYSFGNLTKLDINYYTGWKSLILNINGLYTSSKFKTITIVDSTVDGQLYNSIIKTGLMASMKIISPLLIMVSTDGIFEIDETEAVTGFKGIQYLFMLRYQIFDDLLASFSLSQMFYSDESVTPYLACKLHVKMSF